MKISELINLLSDIKRKHGDIYCITRGDEEEGWDDIVVTVQYNKQVKDYDGYMHNKFEFSDRNNEKYVVINFE